MRRIRSLKPFFISLLLYTFVVGLAAQWLSAPASAVTAADWQAGKIMDDATFANKASMSVKDVQAFLNAKVPVCDTWGTQPISSGSSQTRAQWAAANHKQAPPYTCLKGYYEVPKTEPGPGVPANNYGDKPIPTGAKSAAQLIWDAAQAYSISPKVLLTTIQKESVGPLIVDDWPFLSQYTYALGAHCPDGPNGADCDSDYAGFSIQIRESARLFRYYLDSMDEDWWPDYYKKPGINYILWNVSNATYYNGKKWVKCGGADVNITTKATAALYTYTPYQPNQAALKYMYTAVPSGDGFDSRCAAYGNRNFWRIYSDWFGPTTGTPLFHIGDSDKVYILGSNNNYYYIPSLTILKAYGYPTNVSRIDTAKSSYISGRTFSGNLPLVARFQGDAIYLMDRGEAHHFTSRDMLEKFGYTIGEEATLPALTKLYYQTTGDMQTIVKSADGPEVYSIENLKKRHIIDKEAYDSGSPAYSSLPKVLLSNRYISTIPYGAPIMTQDKLLQRSDKNTWTFWDGSGRQEITNQTVTELGLTPDYTSLSVAIDQLPASGTPVNKLVKSAGGELYLLDTKQKFLVSSSDLGQLNLTSSSFPLTSNGFLTRAGPTKPFARVFRINSSKEVYIVVGGKRYHINDAAALAEQGFTFSQVINLNTRSAALFPDSGRKILSAGTLYRIGQTDKVYFVNSATTSLYVPSSTLLHEYGYHAADVQSFTSAQIAGYPESGKLGYFVKDNSSVMWLIQSGGIKRQVSSTTAGSTKYSLNAPALPVLSDQALGRFAAASNLTDVIQAPGDKKIYKVENGKKRWITTRTKFEALGYSSADVTSVSSAFLSSIPSGPNI